MRSRPNYSNMDVNVEPRGQIGEMVRNIKTEIGKRLLGKKMIGKFRLDLTDRQKRYLIDEHCITKRNQALNDFVINNDLAISTYTKRRSKISASDLFLKLGNTRKCVLMNQQGEEITHIRGAELVIEFKINKELKETRRGVELLAKYAH